MTCDKADFLCITDGTALPQFCLNSQFSCRAAFYQASEHDKTRGLVKALAWIGENGTVFWVLMYSALGIQVSACSAVLNTLLVTADAYVIPSAQALTPATQKGNRVPLIFLGLHRHAGLGGGGKQLLCCLLQPTRR